MYKVKLRKSNIEKRKLRVRKKISGSADMPRVSIFRSNRQIFGQIIDDTKGSTLASVWTKSKDMPKPKSKTDAAFEAGKMLAKKAADKKIKQVVFDRNGYKYHGRVKSFADGLREGGLVL